MTRLSLEEIEIPEPCPASWSKMQGGNAARFCEHCQKHVYNLSAMPREEAERLVCESAGNLCVRFAQTADERVLTLEYQMAGKRPWSWRAWTVIALAGALVTGVVRAALFNDRVMPTGPRFVAGEMRPIPTAGTGGTAPTTCPTSGTDAGGQ